MTALRQGQLTRRAEEAATEVALELGKHASGAPFLKIPRKQNLSLLPNDYPIGYARPLLSQHFSTFEIKEKLQKAFADKGLEDVHFEFGVTSNANAYNLELRTDDFLQEAEDEVHSKRLIVAIVPPDNGSIMDSREPFEHLIIIIPDLKRQVLASMIWMVIFAIVFTLIILTAFGVTVQALLRQKKLSEIKTDFINNMTHEFKTPLATISLAVDALRNEKVLSQPEKMSYFSGIIKEENKRMNKHVETILQAALLDRQELKLDMKKVHAHSLIQSALNNYQLQIQDKNGKVELKLDAENDEIIADENHFTNMLSNLFDNAIKYSRSAPEIVISTRNTNGSIVVDVRDNGIGISAENQRKVFHKFYRVPTGNVHDVKGFGIGLNYVKLIVNAHKGRISLVSQPGKGSTFTLTFPSV